MDLQPLSLSLPYYRQYLTIRNISLLNSLPPTTKIPYKIQRTKGRQLIEERYKFNKKLGQPYKHYIPITIKALAIDYYLKGITIQEVADKLSIQKGSVKRITKQARQRVKEN